jgi:hypothetical protein
MCQVTYFNDSRASTAYDSPRRAPYDRRYDLRRYRGYDLLLFERMPGRIKLVKG